jgi:hypothetical protein
MSPARPSAPSSRSVTGPALPAALILLVALTAWLLDRAAYQTPAAPAVTSALETPLSRETAQILAPLLADQGASISARRSEDGKLKILIATPEGMNALQREQLVRLLAFGLDFEPASGDRLEVEALPRAANGNLLLTYGPAGLAGLAALILLFAWQSACRNEPTALLQTPPARPAPPPEAAHDVTGSVVVQIREWMAEAPRR